MSGRIPPAEMFPAGLPRYATHFVRISSGLTIRVVEALGDVAAVAEPALFIHGWGCTAFVWRKNLPALAAAGVRALAMDLPGHGLSDKPLAGDHYSPDAMADAVLGTLDALGIERAALVAHSLGAAVAARTQTRAPHRISAMVLLAPVGHGRVPLIPLARMLTPKWMERVAPHVTFRWAIAAGLWLSRSSKATLSAREVDEYWAPTQFPEMTIAACRMLHEFDCRPSPRGADSRPRGAGSSSRGAGSSSRGVAPRTLVIVADGDRLVHAPKDAGYHVVHGAGHNVQEQAPDEVNALVLSFLTA